MAIETESVQAHSNPGGASIFQLNTTSVSTAIEAMMAAFPDDIFQFQEIKKDRLGMISLLKRLRFSGFQASVSPSAIKNEGLSAGVFIAVRKHINAQLPAGKDKDGITADPRCIWSRLRLKGWSQTILLANVYCQCGLGIKDSNLDYIRGIAEATGNGHRCAIASGDWNIIADELESSGILEGFGLELVRPSHSDFTCTASKRGT